jgi:hypothetical protein
MTILAALWQLAHRGIASRRPFGWHLVSACWHTEYGGKGRVLGLRFFGGWGYVRAPLIGRWLERNLGLTGFTIYIRIRRTSLGSHWGESTGWVWICGRHFRNGNRVNIFHAWEE